MHSCERGPPRLPALRLAPRHSPILAYPTGRHNGEKHSRNRQSEFVHSGAIACLSSSRGHPSGLGADHLHCGLRRLPSISKATLDAYTAESNANHDISLARFKAFVRATGAVWLWDMIVSEDGLTLLEGDEARLAEIAAIQQERKLLEKQLKTLSSVPVNLKRRGR